MPGFRSSVIAAALTERPFVRKTVPEHTINSGNFVTYMFGCTPLDLEVGQEAGGTGKAHELDGLKWRFT